MNPLAPFEPSPETPWTPGRAAHLLRRAGFAPNPAELARAVEEGVTAAVDRLVSEKEDSARARELDAIGERVALGRDIGALRAWWLDRMRYTRRPLHARMALLWHNHFATSNEKVNDPALMLGQLRLIETHALGRFGDLLHGMVRDPAMIVWLDGRRNVKGRPNENFARELFELFTLGLGAYTEDDIRDAARAFTGWRVTRGRTEFVPRLHDDGEKSVLGRTGHLDGDAVVAAAMDRPETARFIATRLVRTFVADEPGSSTVDALALRLTERGFDLRDAMRTLLASRAMFDDRSRRAKIKSPVEFAVGLARSLDLRVKAPELAEVTSRLGQRLFEPPSVAGWEGGRAWLTSTTMLVRLGAIGAAVEPDHLDALALADRLAAGESRTIVARLAELLLDGAIPGALEAPLADLEGEPDEIVRGALTLMLSAPEYQLS